MGTKGRNVFDPRHMKPNFVVVHHMASAQYDQSFHCRMEKGWVLSCPLSATQADLSLRLACTHLILRFRSHFKSLGFAKLHIHWYNVFHDSEASHSLKSKEEGKAQESIQSSTIPDQAQLMGRCDKNTRIHHTQASQEASPFTIGEQTGQHNKDKHEL